MDALITVIHPTYPAWLSPAETMAVDRLLRSLDESGFETEQLWLYGSRARAASHPESDIDLLWVGNDRLNRMANEVNQRFRDLEWECGLGDNLPALSLLRDPGPSHPLSFWHNVKNDAIRLVGTS